METSPRYQLHLNSKSPSIYSPLVIQSKMYSTHHSEPTKSSLERMYSSQEALNVKVPVSTMSEPKKGNLFQNAFTSLTNILVDQLAKVPASLINNLSNVNNTLSVTIVPNEGIISHEFFKTLTSNKDNLSNNVYKESIQNREPPLDCIDAIRLKSKVFVPKDEFLESPNDPKFPALDDFDMCMDTEPMILYEKPFDNNEIITTQTLEKETSEFNKSSKEKVISEGEIISKDKLTSRQNLQSSKLSLKELPQEKSPSSSSVFSTMWQKVVTGVTDHIRSFSPGSEACTKTYHTTMTRRKPNCVSSGRGRGRGKSQLRKNGVSQSRHRKERGRHELCLDIQDDLDTWEELEAYTVPISCLERNEDLDKEIETESPSYSMNFELIDLITPKEIKHEKKAQMESENFSMKVKYVPECLLKEREATCTIDKTAFRPRLISEASVDSDDSFIIFDTRSDSDFDDFSDLDENETSDSETENDTSDYEAEIESVTADKKQTLKVRFNLIPTVHKMVKWNFAYQAARRGPWQEMARDRDRFRLRVNNIGQVLRPILASDFRAKIWKERFKTEEKF